MACEMERSVRGKDKKRETGRPGDNEDKKEQQRDDKEE